jgi:Tol biopolymer transport system component
MKNLLICFLVSGFLFLTPSPIQAQNHQNIFQKGIIQEEAEGDLTKAIEIYNSLVNDVSVERILRAKALLRVGICYEKLGNKNARKTYQKLISEYADQIEIVALGKEKLNGLKQVNTIAKKDGVIVSQVWSPAQDTYSVSPNGRYLNYIDWTNISLNVKDLTKGTSRGLSKNGTWKEPMQYPDNSIWSRDGKQLAYFWFEDNKSELHIVNTDGSNDRTMVIGNETPWPVTWSPDGKYILSILWDKSKKRIVLFAVNTGTIRTLKSFDGLSLGGQMDISVDNKYIVYSLQQKKGAHGKDIYILSMDGKVNKKVVSNAANDYNPRWTPDGKSIIFISNRYGTNDLWKIRIENEYAVGTPELIKANLGNQARMLGITNNKNLFYATLQSRSDIHLLHMDMGSKRVVNPPLKISLLNNIRNESPAISQDGRFIAYYKWQLFRDNVIKNEVLISIYDTNTGESKNINTSLKYNPNRHWFRLHWSPNGKQLLVYGAHNENNQSGLFMLDIKTKETTAIKVMPIGTSHNIKRQNGTLHVFSNDGKSIYYLSGDRKNIRKINIKSKQETTVHTNASPLSYFKVSKDDSKIAYKHFFDSKNNLFVASTNGGTPKKIVRLENDISPYIIAWDADDKYVYFGTGRSSRNIKSILRVSADGGDPEQIINLTEVFPNGIVTRVVLDQKDSTMAVELEVGKGNEVWKLEGAFNE